MGSLSKHSSFPRKRESSPSAAHFQWLAEWIPAFAGMTAPESARVSQMTPLPDGGSVGAVREPPGHQAHFCKGASRSAPQPREPGVAVRRQWSIEPASDGGREIPRTSQRGSPRYTWCVRPMPCHFLRLVKKFIE